jgi:hypothetical protein
MRAPITIVWLVLTLGLIGCSSTRGIGEFTAYRQAYTSANEAGQAILDRLAVAERAVFHSSEESPSPDNLTFEAVKVRYYVDTVDPPITSSFRSTLNVVRIYNDAVIGLANGEAVEAIMAQVTLIGNAAIGAGSQIAAIAAGPAALTAVTSGVAAPLALLEPLAEFALTQRSRQEFRARLVADHVHVDAVLEGLMKATPEMYAVLTRPLVRSKKSIRGTKPFTDAEMEAVLELRSALANWVILLEGSRIALAAAVSAVQSDSTAGAAASFVATAGELQQAAREVRQNLAASSK